jgi:polyisoprenoid-binding protein YceI
MKRAFGISSLLILLSGMAYSAPYAVDYKNSSIEYSGTHAGNAFKGKFEDWSAGIDFDPAHLDKSTIKASVDLKSAKTGNAMYDGTLPTSDWFNIKEFPKADFVSKEIIQNEDKSYTAKGDLTIRGVTHPASFNFTLSDLSHNRVTAKGNLVIDRLDYNIGKKSDGKAEWVSRDINLVINISATASK